MLEKANRHTRLSLRISQHCLWNSFRISQHCCWNSFRIFQHCCWNSSSVHLIKEDCWVLPTFRTSLLWAINDVMPFVPAGSVSSSSTQNHKLLEKCAWWFCPGQSVNCTAKGVALSPIPGIESAVSGVRFFPQPLGTLVPIRRISVQTWH